MEEQPVINNQVQQPPVNPATPKTNYWLIAIIVFVVFIVLSGIYIFVLKSQKQISSIPKLSISPTTVSQPSRTRKSTPTPLGPDTTPPIISNVQPQGALPFSTKEVTITLETNEPAQCAISDSPGLINQPKPKLFTITRGTSHSITSPEVEKGKSYTFYARCRDEAGNINAEDTVIQFSIEKSGKASPLSSLLPIAIVLIIGIGVIFLIVRRLRKGKDSIVQSYSQPRSKTSKTVTTVAMIALIIIIIGGIGGSFLGTRKNQPITTSPTILPTTPMPTSPSTPDSTQPYVGDIVFPADSGIINVKEYGAKGDGITDDTSAIQKAVSDNLGNTGSRTAVIYFPAGTYMVSNTIVPKKNSNAKGGWLPYLTLQGQNRDKTIIKLKDNAPGYNSKSSPKAVLYTASAPDPGWPEKGEGGQAFGNNIFDLTVDVGEGNPGAIGIDYLANNNGAVRDVKIVSYDQGYIGLALIRNYPGPDLIKNVIIEGFDYGIKSEIAQTITTFEHITLQNQKIAGIHNIRHILAIRDLQSENSVPAIIQEGATEGFITLVDGKLQGSSSQSAIDNRQGEIFVRNVSAPGYSSVIKSKGVVIPNTRDTYKDEYYSFQDEPRYKYSLFDTPKKSLNLPVQETPEIPWDPVDQWVNVRDYGADGSGKTDFDNSPAVKKAIDEANRLGKTTLYFPKGQYAFGDTIRIRGSIRKVHFMMSGVGVVNSPANKFADGRPLIQVDEGTHPALLIEGAGDHFGTGARVGPKTSIKHISSKTLVMRNFGGNYQNIPGSGSLFLEDHQWCGVFRNTKVWARQLDPERCSHAPAPALNPYILNDGSDVWILGLKTEQAATIIETINGGRTEVLGGMFSPGKVVPPDMPAFRNIESSHSLSFATSGYLPAVSQYETIIEETRGGETRKLMKNQMPQRGQGSMVPFFVGY